MPSAVAYLRKSRSDDPDREVSRDVQERAVRELAERDGVALQPEDYFVDWARSADEAKSSRRTAFHALLRRIEAGDVDRVYAYSIDRLYRSLQSFLRLRETCEAHRARVITTREGLVIGGSESPMAQAFASIGAVMAELELNTAKARARAAYRERVARGDYVGQAPYGWRFALDGTGKAEIPIRLEPDPRRPASVVTDAYKQAGGRARTTVRILNDVLRIPAPYGGSWDRSSVLRIVGREAPDLLPVRTSNGRREAAAPETALLAKLLRCHCGRTLTPNRHTERRHGSGAVSMNYYCAAGHAGPDTHGRPYYVSERRLLPWVEVEAARLFISDAFQSGTDDPKAKAALAAREQRLKRLYLDGIMDDAEYRAESRSIAEAREALEARGRTMMVRSVNWRDPPETVNAILRNLWEYVEVGPDLLPVRAKWRVPEWRASFLETAGRVTIKWGTDTKRRPSGQLLDLVGVPVRDLDTRTDEQPV